MIHSTKIKEETTATSLKPIQQQPPLTNDNNVKTIKTKLRESLLCSLLSYASYTVDELKSIATDDKTTIELAVQNMSNDQRNFFQAVTKTKLIKNENEYTGNISSSSSGKSRKIIVPDTDNTSKQENQIYMLEGLPGTGKSFLQTAINFYFQTQTEESVLCVAPTHLIALQQNGMTVHKSIFNTCRNILRVSSFALEKDLINEMVKYHLIKNISDLHDLNLYEIVNLLESLSRYINTRNMLDNTLGTGLKILVDEGTMISNLVFAVLYFSYPTATFIVMYGPNQLPPVSGLPACDKAMVGENIHKSVLNTQMRFHSDEASIFRQFIMLFYNILNRDIYEPPLKQMEYFLENLSIGGNLTEYRNDKNNKILIVSTNRERCNENNNRLCTEGEGPVYNIPAELDPIIPQTYNVESKLGIDRILRIRKGVNCIYKDNNLNIGLVKGMLVKVIDVIVSEKDRGVVKSIKIKDQFGKEHCIDRVYFPSDYEKKQEKNGTDKIPNDGLEPKEYAMVKQFPICLSYSITVHSCQGKTFKDCNIGISLIPEERYQTQYFVALSRVCSPKQLYCDQHPVFWLYPSLKIRDIHDLHKLRKNVDMIHNNKRKCVEEHDDNNKEDIKKIKEEKKEEKKEKEKEKEKENKNEKKEKEKEKEKEEEEEDEGEKEEDDFIKYIYKYNADITLKYISNSKNIYDINSYVS